MKRSRLLIVAILLPLLTSFSVEVHAWSPETRVRIVQVLARAKGVRRVDLLCAVALDVDVEVARDRENTHRFT